jgi:multicomponent Na+:H+ antiporter subunit D
MYTVVLVLSVTTMVVGMIGALGQRDFRRVLSFNLIGHIGFTTLGLALWTPFALAASIFYMLHHILVITTLFLVSGLLLRLRRTTQLSELGGLYRTHTVVAVLAMIPLFSLAGVPPLSGFIAKLAIVQAALDVGHYRVAGIALVVSLLTVLSMARLWDEAFWKPAPSEAGNAPLGRVIVVPVAVLAMLTVALAIAAEPVLDVSRRSADQLLQPDEYIRAVLGDQ